jgi:exosortase
MSPARVSIKHVWIDLAARSPRRWGLAGQAALVALLYGNLLGGLALDWWNEPGLSYGLLVAPLALWVAYQGRQRTLAVPATPDAAGLVAVAGACLCYVAGMLAAEVFLQRISLPALLAGLTWTHWGRARLRTLTFPLMLLAAMVPLPGLVYGSLSLPLQLLASNIGADVARLFGVVVLREGNVLHLAGVSLGVEEACSGLNSLAALMVTSIVLGFLVCRNAWSRVALFLCWGPIATGVNVLRVSMTAVLADFDRAFALGFYHLFSGWLVYLAAFLLLYGTAEALNRISGLVSRPA